MGRLHVRDCTLNAHSTLHREQAVRQEFAYRVPLETKFLLNGDPVSNRRFATNYLAGSADGYRLVTGEHDLG